MSLAEKEKEKEAAGTVDVILEEREGVGGWEEDPCPPTSRRSFCSQVILGGAGAAVTTESLLWFCSQLSFNAK